jgi:hypothetical protein
MCKKRHILADTQGLLMQAIVHAADIQDRDGGAVLMATLFGAFPFLTRLVRPGSPARTQWGYRIQLRQICISDGQFNRPPPRL